MSYSFDTKNSKDLFNEFCIRSKEYREDPMSSGNAVICAILSWHVVEWIYQEYASSLTKYPRRRDFQDHVRHLCPSLNYMQDIANGSKHRGITRYTLVVKKTESHQGAFSSGFSKGFNISRLEIELDEGTIVYFDEELGKVEEFFRDFFLQILKVSV